MVAVTDVSANEVPTTTSTSKRWKRPRTFDTPRWRIVKPTLEWFGSSAQRPGTEREAEVGGGHGVHPRGSRRRAEGRRDPGPRRAILTAAGPGMMVR